MAEELKWYWIKTENYKLRKLNTPRPRNGRIQDQRRILLGFEHTQAVLIPKSTLYEALRIWRWLRNEWKWLENSAFIGEGQGSSHHRLHQQQSRDSSGFFFNFRRYALKRRIPGQLGIFQLTWSCGLNRHWWRIRRLHHFCHALLASAPGWDSSSDFSFIQYLPGEKISRNVQQRLLVRFSSLRLE